MNWFIVEEAVREAEEEEARSNMTAQLAEVDRQIEEIKAQLEGPGDDPELWPLRRELVALYDKRRDLLEQQKGRPVW